MKKNLLIVSLMNIGLLFTACIEKDIVPNNNPQVTPTRATPVVAPISTPIKTPSPIPTTRAIIAPSTDGESYQLKTIQGSMLSVQERSNGFVFPQYQDKIIMLQVFGEDCPSCLKEMPIINRLKHKYANQLQIIAFHGQDNMSQQTALNVIQRYNMNYPVVDKDEAITILRFLQNNYEWTGILPYMLLIKNGVTEFSFSGTVSQQELDKAVKSLL